MRLARAWVSPVPVLVLATFAPEGSGATIRKWALSLHLLLCSFQRRHVPISGSPAFPLPSCLPQSYNLTRVHRVLLSTGGRPAVPRVVSDLAHFPHREGRPAVPHVGWTRPVAFPLQERAAGRAPRAPFFQT